MENKNEGKENKIILGDFNCTMDKLEGRVEIKYKYFIDAVPIIPLLWIKGLRIYREGTIQIPLSSSATIGPLARIQYGQGLY